MNRDSLYKSRILALKIIAEYYLLTKGNKKTDEIFADRTISDDMELAAGDLVVLHNWLRDEYASYGADLDQIISDNEPEGVGEDEVSKYEMDLYIEKADRLVSIFGILDKYLVANNATAADATKDADTNTFINADLASGTSLADKWNKISADLADFGKEVAEKLDK